MHLITISLYCILVIHPVAQALQPNRLWQKSNQPVPHNSVEVKSVVKVFIAKNAAVFLLDYDYDFPEQSTVHIDGLGTVPAKGAFRYFSSLKTLVFRDDRTQNILAEVPLKETVVVAAKPPLNEVPSQAEFPPAFQSFVWEGASSFPAIANAVLGKYFHYLPQEANGQTFFATTFTPLALHDVPSGVLGQVALLLSFPYDRLTRKYSFHVQCIVREGRSHSDEFRPTSNYSILQSADSFVADLVKEMKAAGENKVHQ